MGVQQLALGFGEQELISTPSSSTTSSSSLTITFKRLRPIEALTSLTLQSFNPPKPRCNEGLKPDGSPVEAQSGGTRWNPTQEQIGTLEAMYNGGMRTPSAAQIEQITAELGRYGRIEGKNVFYWFQNHKARERQKQKRSTSAVLALADYDSSPRPIANVCRLTSSHSISKRNQLLDLSNLSVGGCMQGEEEVCGGYHDGSCKRQCRSWGARLERQEGEDDRTLELFPLRPEGAK